MLNDSQKTRIDVDVLDETTLTKTIDEYLHIKSPLEKDLELKDSKNVWYPDDVGFLQADSFTGYDTLVFDMNFPELLYKVVNGVHISFTMSTDKTVLVEKVGIVGLINSYTNVDFAVKGTSDVDVTVDLSEVNNDELISLLGESKLFIFVDLKCDLDIASINIMNPKVDVAFTKELYDEVLSVNNRVTGSLDFYLEGDEIILRIGDGEERGRQSDDPAPVGDTYTKAEIDDKLSLKVDVQDGKRLSTEDYTTSEKTKLANVEDNANYYVHPSTHSTGMVLEPSALNRLETSANATQHEINLKINEKIGQGGGGSSSIGCVADFDIDYLEEELELDTCNGKVIMSITKSTSGNVDTYTILYNDDSTYEFTVTNGSSGGVIGTGSFSIDNNGHLIVELPSGVSNPYTIDNNGHLIYNTGA